MAGWPAGWLEENIEKYTEWPTVDLEGVDSWDFSPLLQCNVFGLIPIAIPPVREVVVAISEDLTVVTMMILSSK